MRSANQPTITDIGLCCEKVEGPCSKGRTGIENASEEYLDQRKSINAGVRKLRDLKLQNL
jgi:hypothetical protein